MKFVLNNSFIIKSNTFNTLNKFCSLINYNLKLYYIAFFIIIFYNALISNCDDNLKINFLPSNKYKLSNKDLSILEDDLERQLSEKMYELQSHWDVRENLRRQAISKPPIIPPYPIPSPPINIPINANAFNTNLDFESAHDGSLYNRSKDNIADIEEDISNMIDKKMQEFLAKNLANIKNQRYELEKQIENKNEEQLDTIQHNISFIQKKDKKLKEDKSNNNNNNDNNNNDNSKSDINNKNSTNIEQDKDIKLISTISKSVDNDSLLKETNNKTEIDNKNNINKNNVNEDEDIRSTSLDSADSIIDNLDNNIEENNKK